VPYFLGEKGFAPIGPPGQEDTDASQNQEYDF
jgi:hypothetical protein